MSSEVQQHTLESLCLLVVDCPHATPAWTDSGVVVLRNQNIKGGRLDLSSPSFTDETHYLGRIRRAAPQSGDLVITREAPMGEVCQIPPGLKCCLGQRQVLLRPDPTKVDSRFLLYALQSPYLQHQIGWNEGTGSTVSNLRIPVLEALRVPTPALHIQKEVAETLGAIDDRITLLRETNATLEAIAQALFKSWFVDFDPVRAKMEGCAPEGMDEATAALFPDSLEETELGVVPRGWVAGTFGDVLTEHSKRIGSLQATVLSAVQTGELVRSDEHFNKRVHSESIEKYKSVPPLAFAYNPSRINIGSIGINESNNLGAVSPVYVVATTLSKGAAYLVWHHLRSQRVRGTIATLATGTVRQSLSYSDFASISLVIPSTKVLDAFLEYRNALYQRIWSISDKIRLLAEIRDTLLPRLISGQLRLPEAQAQLEDALT